jgi:hypothetical protein
MRFIVHCSITSNYHHTLDEYDLYYLDDSELETLQAGSIRSSVYEREGCVRFDRDVPGCSITDAYQFIDEESVKEGSETYIFINSFLSDNELSDFQIRVNSVELLHK